MSGTPGIPGEDHLQHRGAQCYEQIAVDQEICKINIDGVDAANPFQMRDKLCE